MKIFFVLILGLFALTSCTNKYENLLRYNTAEVREFVFEGETADVKANLICGKREKEYKVNGYATELIEFGVLTFEVNNIDEYDETIAKYVLLVGTDRYDGDLQKNPFDSSLVVDIKKIIDKNLPVKAIITIGEFSREIELKYLCQDWKVTSDDVYSIVASKYKDEIMKLNDNNIFNGEIYIKILNDKDIYKGDYYWYVNLISRNGGSLSMIISPFTKEILAVNNTIEKIA